MRTFSLFTAGLVAAAAIAAPAAAGREDHKNKLGGSEPQYFACTEGDDRETGDRIVFNGDQQLWPPNHKYAPYPIQAIGDNGDEDITLTTWLTHDEYVVAWEPEGPEDQPGDEEVGAGNTVDDGRPFFLMDTTTGSGFNENLHEIRAERSGRGDGRTYTFNIDARIGDKDCDAQVVTVTVPHDRRSETAPPKEDRTDSTGPDQDDSEG